MINIKKSNIIKNIKTAVILITLSISPLTVFANSAVVTDLNEPLVIAKKYNFQSKRLGEDRTFYVHLPDNYPLSGKTYPVLYIPDAQNKMQKTAAITDDLTTFGKRIPAMIVVGIETNKNRKADLSTFDSSITFLNFITQELKPYINEHYQTSGENLLMGSSMGGEFVLRALLEQPNQFNGYFAISPSVYYSDFTLVDKAIQISNKKQVINKKLYLSVANEGWNQGVDMLVYHLKKHPIQGLEWQFDKLEHESHGSISFRKSYTDLQDYYQGWAAPHFKNIQDFETQGAIEGLLRLYAKRSPSVIPVSLLDHIAILYLDEQQADNAIELSLLAVKEHPTSGRVWRNLAFIYEKLSMQNEALAALEQALSTAILNKHRARSIASHKKALTEFKAKQG
ncbi:alpha/beta hydrolase-fold protein [Colwellia psychrerythraea]|nr:alpha/beta hydrolase-fold protein [Colwellia psychrerythraea]